MATTTSFKNTADNAHRVRALTTEESFAMGMRTTSAPLDSGYVKTLCNYSLKNDGEVLSPRAGLRTSFISSFPSAGAAAAIHSTGLVQVKRITSAGTTYELRRYILLTTTALGAAPVDTLMCWVDYQSNETASSTSTVRLDPIPMPTGHSYAVQFGTVGRTIHGMEVGDHGLNSRGEVVSVGSNTFLFMTVDGANKLARLDITLNDTTIPHTNTWALTIIQPKEIAATQVVNYGYNMLKDDPYAFSNTATSNSEIKLTGIIPYSANGKVLLAARAGQTVNFKLYYNYPSSHATTDKYFVQWEMYDLAASGSSITVVQDMSKSPVYTPGNEINFSFEPSIQQFGLTVKIFRVSKITTAAPSTITTTAQLATLIKDYTGDINAEQTLNLASYYLTSEESTAVVNIETAKYSLCSATGACSWAQRAVLWGVKDAKNMLFVSEINSPDYFPYPNGCEIFSDDIVKAVPYMGKLLVFTKTAIYMLTQDGSTGNYTTKVVQENISITHDDACMIRTVQNMVYFKAGNYYYLVVPKIQSLTGELQLAPVSRPIEQFLDSFEHNLYTLLDDMYAITTENVQADISVMSYGTMLTGNQVRNNYLVRIISGSKFAQKTRYVVFSLLYDTVLRAWTSSVFEAGSKMPVLYSTLATGDNVYVMPYQASIYICSEDYTTCEDSHLTPVTYNNTQYLDTGFRKHAEQNKKRFREMQFCVGAVDQHMLKFYTAFYVDSDERRSFFKYNTVHITDPTSPNYGQVLVERSFEDALESPSTTIFDTEWVLDTSMFPEITNYKIRYKVSGKGYGGRMKLLSANFYRYELLNVNWVYRTMFAR